MELSSFRKEALLSKSLQILFVSSELEDFAKTGGLADVIKALPLVLQKQGHDVRIVVPYYPSIAETHETTLRIESCWVQMGEHALGCSVYETKMQNIPVYLVEHLEYFSRPRIYDQDGYEYADNAERFGFLSKVSLEICHHLQLQPDIVHAHDWQSALLPYYLKQAQQHGSAFAKTKSVLTIHNGAFQGLTAGYKISLLGIGAEAFQPDAFEDHGMINLLKGGIYYADQVNAVSPGYAKELVTPLGGHGLHALFQKKGKRLRGILNGCDYQTWNPEQDAHLPANYSAKEREGKQKCKSALQEYCQLAPRADIPILGVVSRLTEQKGFAYLLPALHRILQQEVQLVVLGTGEAEIEQQFTHLAQEFPQQVGWFNHYSEALSHSIEAGSDIFLMPSLYEPCGLNQMYSLRYGTLPLVRKVGGLGDTVYGYPQSGKKATGFVFSEPDSTAVYTCLADALALYRKEQNIFQELILNAMSQDFSWEKSVGQYEQMYMDALQEKDS